MLKAHKYSPFVQFYEFTDILAGIFQVASNFEGKILRVAIQATIHIHSGPIILLIIPTFIIVVFISAG